MKTYLIADLHFGDEDIIKYENRPFNNAIEMNNQLVDNWNNIVSKEDRVFIVGDYSKMDFEKTKQITRQLNGKKYLVIGNHDEFSLSEYLDMGFLNAYDYPILIDGFFLLSHEPLYVNENMPYVNIYGHIHGNPNYNTFSSCGHCVSVEKIEYKPIDLEEIKKKILTLRK